MADVSRALCVMGRLDLSGWPKEVMHGRKEAFELGACARRGNPKQKLLKVSDPPARPNARRRAEIRIVKNLQNDPPG